MDDWKIVDIYSIAAYKWHLKDVIKPITVYYYNYAWGCITSDTLEKKLL